MFYTTVTPPPVVTDCCITGYTFVTADIGFTGNGGDSWDIDYPLSPVTVNSSGSIVGFTWAWSFWQNGAEVATNYGYATADHTVTLGGYGAGVYLTMLEYEFADGLFFTLHKYVEVNGTDGIVRYASIRGIDLIGSIDCLTLQTRGYIHGENVTLQPAIWALGIVETGTLSVLQNDPNNYQGTLPEYGLMHVAYTLELDYLTEWGGHLTHDVSALFAFNNIATNCQ